MKNSQKWYLFANGQNARVFCEKDGKLVHIIDINPTAEPTTATRATAGHQAGGQGSVYYTSDPQDRLNGHDEKVFIAEVSNWLTYANDDNKFDELVIAASPKTLGYIREKLDKRVKDKITQEMDKDFINTPLPEIEEALFIKSKS